MLYSTRIALGAVYCVCSAFFCRAVVQKLRAGWPRLLAVMPLVVTDFLLPLLFDPYTEAPSILIFSLCLTFLHSFKVVGLACNRGALCQPLTLTQTIALLGLPVTFENDTQQRLKGAVNPGAVAVKLPLLIALLRADQYLQHHSTGLQAQLHHLLYGWVAYLFMGSAMDVASGLLLAVGTRIKPHFDQPYLSSSLQDFWGRRWNNSVSSTLRFMVYDPIMEGRWVKAGKVEGQASRSRQVVAMMATFAVSGFFHEILLAYYRVPWRYHGYWFLFFSLQGPLYLAELAVKRLARRHKVQIPGWASIVLVQVVLLAAADAFFFPPLIPSGLGPRMMGSLRGTFSCLPPLARLYAPVHQA